MTLEPSRVALARLRAGLSKTKLADRIGATVRTVTNYETHGAPDRVAADLAEALGCPSGYFFKPATGGLEEDRVFFRARRRTSASIKHSATSAGRTGAELYTLITAYFDLPELSIPDLGDTDPLGAAQQLRAQWGLGIDPLPNCVHLAEAHGVRVLSLPEGTQDVDAFSVWDGGNPYVFLSVTKTPERSRFDIAHEIGHLVLHAGLEFSTESERNAEKEANQFASEFLMPRVLLRSLIGREPGIDAILKLKVRLGVSAMALAYALHKAELISEWSYRQVCVELTKLGYRTAEPEGMLRETSRVFKVVLPGLRNSKGWGTEDVARQLGVNASELHGLTFGQAIVDVSSARGIKPIPQRSRNHLTLIQ